jgi:hypothetical protein
MSLGGVTGPTNPYVIARAYGLPSAASPAVVGRIGPAGAVEPAAKPTTRESDGLERLVAAVVPGGVDFSGPAPTPRMGGADVLPFYRRPGDRNEAATQWLAGRSLDISG